MKKAPSQVKGRRDFSFWSMFQAEIQATGSLPDPRPGVSSGAVVSSLRKEQDQLFNVFQFRL